MVHWLVTNPHDWINRRVESIEVLDEARVRRRVSIDCALPTTVPVGGILVTPSIPVMPLTFLRKRKLQHFDLIDENGGSLPALTRTENGHLAWAVLCCAAEDKLDDWPKTKLTEVWPDDELAQDFRGVATGRGSEPDEALARIERKYRGEASCSGESLNDDSFIRLVRTLTRDFILFADVEPKAGQRRVLKFSYEESIRERPFSLRARVRARITAQPYPFSVEVPAVGQTRSFHFEMTAPEDLAIAASALIVGDPRTPEAPPMLADSERSPGARTHLRASDVDVSSSGVAQVFLRAQLHGFLTASVVTAFLIAITLWTGRIVLGQVANDVEAMSRLLVVFPGLLTVYLVRPGEHELATRS